MNLIKKVIWSFVLIFVNIQFVYATNIETQIFKAKPVSMYDLQTEVDEMNTVTFGSYPQASTKQNELEEPIEWLVLERDYKNNRALLFSKYILDNVRFNSDHKDCKWKESELRQWLNNEFYNKAFNDSEKKEIVEVSHISNLLLDNEAVDAASDKVFLLSSNEVDKYFKRSDMLEENKRLATRGTNYAKNVDVDGIKLWVRQNTGENTFGTSENGVFYNRIVERYGEEAYKFEWCIGNSFYWLRSNGIDLSSVARVNSNGALMVGTSNYSVSNCQGGIRPAIWVSYNKKISVGDKDVDDFESIKLGKYKQSYNSKNNDWNEDPIEWIILEKDKKNKRALILSKYILDCRTQFYKSGEKNTTWEKSNMRNYLNGKFYDNVFTEEEKNKILEVTLVNDDNVDYLTIGGEDTVDKVFLLSISEAKKYLSPSENVDNMNQLVRAGATKGTAYAEHRLLGKFHNDKFNDYEDWQLENGFYYLRSPGCMQNRIASVEPSATISTSGSGGGHKGIRPAMWIEYE